MPNVIAEMVLIRLIYASDLPTAEELVKDLLKKNHDSKIDNDESKEEKSSDSDNTIKEQYHKTEKAPSKGINTDTVIEMKNVDNLLKDPNSKVQENNIKIEKKDGNIVLSSFKDVANFFLKKKEILLFNHLFSHVRLVHFQKGKPLGALE